MSVRLIAEFTKYHFNTENGKTNSNSGHIWLNSSQAAPRAAAAAARRDGTCMLKTSSELSDWPVMLLTSLDAWEDSEDEE